MKVAQAQFASQDSSNEPRRHLGGNNRSTACSGQTLALVIGITTGAAVLRLLWLGHKSLWLDEGISYFLATAQNRPHESVWAYQALYHELLRWWIRLVGDSEFMMRLLSVIPGTAAIPLIFVVGKRLFHERVGIYSALFLAVNVTLISFSQEARGYAQVMLFALAAVYAFVRAIESSSAPAWIAYVLFSALAIWSHLLAALMAPALLLALLALPRRAVPWLPAVLSTVALPLAALPQVWLIFRTGVSATSFISSASYRELPGLLLMLAGDNLTIPIFVFLWIVAFRWALHTPWVEGRSIASFHAALLISWAATPIVLLMLVSLARPAFVPRYLLVCAPAWTILAARALADWKTQPRLLLISVTVVASVAALVYHQTRPREDWRGAAQYVYENAQPGDAVLVLPPYSRLPWFYYRHRLGGEMIPLEVPGKTATTECFLPEVCCTAGPETPPDLSAIPWFTRLSRYRRLWVIRYQRAEPDYATKMYEGAIAQGFLPGESRTFRWIDVQQFWPTRSGSVIEPSSSGHPSQ